MGTVLAGPVREREETLVVDLDIGEVRSARRYLDAVGHYHRPDLFRLSVDTAPRPAVVEMSQASGDGVGAQPASGTP